MHGRNWHALSLCHTLAFAGSHGGCRGGVPPSAACPGPAPVPSTSSLASLSYGSCYPLSGLTPPWTWASATGSLLCPTYAAAAWTGARCAPPSGLSSKIPICYIVIVLSVSSWMHYITLHNAPLAVGWLTEWFIPSINNFAKRMMASQK